jgi:hypothetical protein
MSEWTNLWQLSFNLDKCVVMRITHHKDKSIPEYYLSDKKLKVANEFKDLGVIVSSDLSWSNQVASTVKKANRIVGLIKRTIGFSSTSIFSTLYKSLVRPVLEYAAPVWSPYLVKDVKALERVQRRASRIALKQKRGEMPYNERCKLLKWDTLEKRRKFLSLVECYKIVFELNGGITFSEVLEYRHSKRTRSNHQYTLYPKLPKINCYKYSLFVRIISDWNSLPCSVVEVNNIREFKRELKSNMDMYL